MPYTIRLFAEIVRTEHTFLRHMSFIVGQNGTVRTDKHTGQTPDALVLIDPYHLPVKRQGARNTGTYANSIRAMTAIDRKMHVAIIFHADIGMNFFAFERLDHIREPRVRKSTFVFAKMTAQAPFFVYIDAFHKKTSARGTPQRRLAGFRDYLPVFARQAITAPF